MGVLLRKEAVINYREEEYLGAPFCDTETSDSTLKVWPLLAVHATTTTSVAEALLLRPGIPNTETSTKSEMHNVTKRFVFIFELPSELAIHRSRNWTNRFGVMRRR